MSSHQRSESFSAAAVIIALCAVAMHCVVNYFSPYEIHRDEFLYLAMGEHLKLWQMDFPPFIAVAARASHQWFGDSLVAVRFFPALAGGLLMLVAIDATRRLGGKAYAQVLTAVAMLASGMYLRTANLFQPVIFDELWWTIGLWCLLRWRQSGSNLWWAALGVVMGIGLFTKFSILFFGFGVLLGLILTRERTLLATRWPWIALVLTLAVGLPSLVGQYALGFPVRGQIDNLQHYQLVHVSYMDFILGQLMNLGGTVIVVLTGIIALLVSKRFSSYRILAWVFIGAFGALLLTHGKAYYIGPIYPVMIAAGAVVIEQTGSGRMAGALRSAMIILLVAVGLPTIPFGLPIVPPPQMAQYTRTLGMTAAVKTNHATVLSLPQDYADMLGWKERVEELARIYRTLTPAQRADAIILAGNYGEAGAVDFYGPHLGLPRAVCTSGTYWYFGPGAKPGHVAITIGCDEPSLKRNWTRVTAAGHLSNAWTVEEEQQLTFYVCEGEMKSIQSLWPLFEGRN